MIDNSKEYILCAAIHVRNNKKYEHQPKNIESGIVICGLRHPNCFISICEIFYPNWRDDDFQSQVRKDTLINKIQGFLTSKDRFVDRREAFNIALEAGQIEGGKLNGQLYSEDLY